ncbi:MAG TPA: hypothetical protein VHD35_13115 [Chitinophagaceae bacterium]|nr:hypothetical protein [Chitinophagaceae bacterium]
MREILFPLCLAILISLTGCWHSDTADYLIPANYTGRIAVVFNQQQGQKPKYSNGRRIYEIPANGILLTQFDYKPGFVNYRYFHVDKKGNKTLLPIYEYDYNKDGTVHYLVKNKEQIGIFGNGTSVAYASDGSAPGLEVFVSTFNGLDTVEKMEHFNQRVDTLLGLAH